MTYPPKEYYDSDEYKRNTRKMTKWAIPMAIILAILVLLVLLAR